MKLVPLSGIKVSGGAAMLRSSCVVPAPLVSFSLSPPPASVLSLFLSHFLFPLLWLSAYELALALPHYTPSGALKRQGRRS